MLVMVVSDSYARTYRQVSETFGMLLLKVIIYARKGSGFLVMPSGTLEVNCWQRFRG